MDGYYFLLEFVDLVVGWMLNGWFGFLFLFFIECLFMCFFFLFWFMVDWSILINFCFCFVVRFCINVMIVCCVMVWVFDWSFWWCDKVVLNVVLLKGFVVVIWNVFVWVVFIFWCSVWSFGWIVIMFWWNFCCVFIESWLVIFLMGGMKNFVLGLVGGFMWWCGGFLEFLKGNWLMIKFIKRKFSVSEVKS